MLSHAEIVENNRTPKVHQPTLRTHFVVQYRGSLDELVVLETPYEDVANEEATRLAVHYDKVTAESYGRHQTEQAIARATEGANVPCGYIEVPWESHDPVVAKAADVFSVDTSTYHNISVVKCVDGRPVSMHLFCVED